MQRVVLPGDAIAAVLPIFVNVCSFIRVNEKTNIIAGLVLAAQENALLVGDAASLVHPQVFQQFFPVWVGGPAEQGRCTERASLAE